jgi:hypothetical protein
MHQPACWAACITSITRWWAALASALMITTGSLASAAPLLQGRDNGRLAGAIHRTLVDDHVAGRGDGHVDLHGLGVAGLASAVGRLISSPAKANRWW